MQIFQNLLITGSCRLTNCIYRVCATARKRKPANVVRNAENPPKWSYVSNPKDHRNQIRALVSKMGETADNGQIIIWNSALSAALLPTCWCTVIRFVPLSTSLGCCNKGFCSSPHLEIIAPINTTQSYRCRRFLTDVYSGCLCLILPLWKIEIINMLHCYTNGHN